MTPHRRYYQPRADQFAGFCAQKLRHTKDRYAGQPFVLTDWQRAHITDPLFGTLEWDPEIRRWIRAYDTCYIECGRGNGKSALLAAIVLYMLCGTGEPMAEVYGVAGDKDQALLVYDVAARMAKIGPLNDHLDVVRSERLIRHEATGSTYRVPGGMDELTNLGLNPSAVILDEVVAQKDRTMYDALRTSMGKRDESLLVAATTPAPGASDFAEQLHEQFERVAQEPDLDPAAHVFMRNAPADADIGDREAWKAANPALGDFLRTRTLVNEHRRAVIDPTAEPAFRAFRLAHWVSGGARLLHKAAWDACDTYPDLDLTGRLAFVGVDLAATSDLASVATVIPDPDTDRLHIRWTTWAPAAVQDRLDKATNGHFRRWVADGRIVLCHGDVIDHDDIAEHLKHLAAEYRIHEIGLDPWNAAAVIQRCDEADLPTAHVRQGYALSSSVTEITAQVAAGTLDHGGDPVARWAAIAADVQADTLGRIRLIRPKRDRSRHRIDPIAAAVTGIDRLLAYRPKPRADHEFIAL